MIQRIQTVWLFLASLVTASTLFFGIYTFSSGVEIDLQSNYIAIVLVAVGTLMSLFNIFNFKKRNNQLNLIWINILVLLVLLGWMFFSITKHELYTLASGRYMIGAFVPLVSIILLFMARTGIKKDIKLLKAYDRLR